MKLWMRCMALWGAGILAACFDGEPVLTESIAELDKDSEHLEELDEDLSSSSAAAEKKSSSSRSKRHSDDEEWEDDELDDDYTLTKKSSSSQKVANGENSSTSGTVQPITGLGSCAPVKTPISKGESVAWAFMPNGMANTLDFVQGKGSLVWSLNPTGIEAGESASKLQSAPITYSAAGDYKASVVATLGLESEMIACSPLRVNGAPITGCECNLNSASEIVDIAGASTVATWNVHGCSSATEIIDYTWVGATGTGETATATISQKGQEIAPTVRIRSLESEIEVACPAPKVVDSDNPEYLFLIDGGSVPLDELEIKNGGCMSIRGTWNGFGYNPELNVYCEGMSTDYGKGITFRMTYNSNVIAEHVSDWGFAYLGGPIGVLSDGEVSFENICVEFTGMETVSCKLR